MNKLLVCALFLLNPVILYSFDTADYSGFRTSASKNELSLTGSWAASGGLKISWEITDISEKHGDFSWYYIYSITDESGQPLSVNIRNFLIETDPTAIANDFAIITSTSTVGPRLYTSRVLPGNLFGLQAYGFSLSTLTYEFYSDWSPEWGDFFAYGTDGSKAYNIGYGTDPTSSPFVSWIPTPTGKLPVPEPCLSILLGSAIGGILLKKRKHRNSK